MCVRRENGGLVMLFFPLLDPSPQTQRVGLSWIQPWTWAELEMDLGQYPPPTTGGGGSNLPKHLLGCRTSLRYLAPQVQKLPQDKSASSQSPLWEQQLLWGNLEGSVFQRGPGEGLKYNQCEYERLSLEEPCGLTLTRGIHKGCLFLSL